MKRSTFKKMELESIASDVKLLFKLEPGAKLLIILPNTLRSLLIHEEMDSLPNDVETKLSSHLIDEEEVHKVLGSDEFIKAIIANYSGCSLGDDLLKDFAFEAPNPGGYVLLARVIGEG